MMLLWEIWDAEYEALLGCVMASSRSEAIRVGIVAYRRGIIFAVPAGDPPMEVA
jgi:hypothetical protein